MTVAGGLLGSFPCVLFICISSVSTKFYLELSSSKLFSLKPNYVQYINCSTHSLIRPKMTLVDVCIFRDVLVIHPEGREGVRGGQGGRPTMPSTPH